MIDPGAHYACQVTMRHAGAESWLVGLSPRDAAANFLARQEIQFRLGTITHHVWCGDTRLSSRASWVTPSHIRTLPAQGNYTAGKITTAQQASQVTVSVSGAVPTAEANSPPYSAYSIGRNESGVQRREIKVSCMTCLTKGMPGS